MIEINKKELAGYHSDIVNGISELIKLPTVYDSSSASKQMPYGKNVYSGYQWLKEKALSDGFEVLEYDRHALAIRRKFKTAPAAQQLTQKRKRIDVVSHVDVVEPGEGWSGDPFSGAITKEYIHGRGAQDMKGALIITYYALKYMAEHQLPCKNEIRVVIGCDEERTMQDMKYYISKSGEPDFAFTPDGKFPYTQGEKGALMWHIDGNLDTCIYELDGGIQCNVVSPKASALVNDAEHFETYKKVLSEKKYNGDITIENSKVKIVLYGKAAHASVPQDGANATTQLLDLIHTVSKDQLASLLYQCFYDYNGTGGNIAYDIAPMGKLTLNLGILKIQDNKISADIDCRYPYGVTSDVLTNRLRSALIPLKVDLKYDDKPTLSDSNSSFIKTLLNSYQNISGDFISEPIISGGVTYSKVIGNCVAFGPSVKGTMNLAHQADEKLAVNSIDTLFKIYTDAMIQLGNL